MIYLLIFSILFPVINAAVNYFMLINNQFAWHSFQAILVSLVILFIPFITSKIKIEKTRHVFLIAFWFFTFYWILFDLFLNIFRGVGWLYVGSVSVMDTCIGDFQFYIKIGCLFFTSFIIISLFKFYRVKYSTYKLKVNQKRVREVIE